MLGKGSMCWGKVHCVGERFNVLGKVYCVGERFNVLGKGSLSWGRAECSFACLAHCQRFCISIKQKTKNYSQLFHCIFTESSSCMKWFHEQQKRMLLVI